MASPRGAAAATSPRKSVLVNGGNTAAPLRKAAARSKPAGTSWAEPGQGADRTERRHKQSVSVKLPDLVPPRRKDGIRGRAKELLSERHTQVEKELAYQRLLRRTSGAAHGELVEEYLKVHGDHCSPRGAGGEEKPKSRFGLLDRLEKLQMYLKRTENDTSEAPARGRNRRGRGAPPAVEQRPSCISGHDALVRDMKLRASEAENFRVLKSSAYNAKR